MSAESNRKIMEHLKRHGSLRTGLYLPTPHEVFGDKVPDDAKWSFFPARIENPDVAKKCT